MTSRIRIVTGICTLFVLWAGAADAALRRTTQTLDANAIGNGGTTAIVRSRARGAAVVRAAILLDRAHFSPGEITDRYDDNLRTAIVSFQRARSFPPTGVVDASTWASLNQDESAAVLLVPYTIAPEDVAGPFSPIPSRMSAKAKLSYLGYASAIEGLAERFHVSTELLRQLNPGKGFSRGGETIIVPNVRTASPGVKAFLVVVDGNERTVSVFDNNQKVIASYPASVGSRHDPLPVGTWTINGVQRNPVFHFDPNLFWDRLRGDTAAKIPPGPNNPVGLVWIDLSRDHYGIHGTPEPSMIGRSYSHGCIRLTNWDALELASIVSPGLKTILQ